MNTITPRTIPEYLDALRRELQGADPSLVQDALYDAEDYLRSELAEQPGHGLPVAKLFREMREGPVRFTGSWLAHAGLPMPIQKAESVAVFRVEAAA